MSGPGPSSAANNLDGPATSTPIYNPPTIAAFSPVYASPASKSTFQVHQKSPLLVATPPRITQALSVAYPWLQVANWIMGLLTWTSPDPWESFLVCAVFWATCLYGSFLLRWMGNLLAVILLIAGMFLRRYREAPTSTTLDEILNTLTTLNVRMDIFFSPFLTLLNILSTQKTATIATTRPALTTLFIRILLTTPIYLVLSVWPLQLLTPRRIVLFCGTLMLSWHSRPAKVARTILWRSHTFRTLSETLTGLTLAPTSPQPLTLPARNKTGLAQGSQVDLNTPLHANTKGAAPGVKFTFAIYENQRRWLGIGWTASMFPSERAPWTDEHLQPCPAPAQFALPETAPGSGVRWQWVACEDWDVEGAAGGKDREGSGHVVKQEVKDRLGGSGESGEGWWYYDNKWHDGRRGLDGWGKYTRRRKWARRAELVEFDEAAEAEAQTEVGETTPPQSLPDTSSPETNTIYTPGTAGTRPPSESERLPPPVFEERLEEDERDDDDSGVEAPEIRIVDVGMQDEDRGHGSGNSSGSNAAGVVKRKPVPPPLPAKRPRGINDLTGGW